MMMLHNNGWISLTIQVLMLLLLDAMCSTKVGFGQSRVRQNLYLRLKNELKIIRIESTCNNKYIPILPYVDHNIVCRNIFRGQKNIHHYTTMYIYAHSYKIYTHYQTQWRGGGTLKNAVVINTLVSKGMQKVIGMQHVQYISYEPFVYILSLLMLTSDGGIAKVHSTLKNSGYILLKDHCQKMSRLKKTCFFFQMQMSVCSFKIPAVYILQLQLQYCKAVITTRQ